MPRPRVIFVNRVYWPNEAATAQLLTDLTRELAARDWMVDVVTSGKGTEKQGGVTIHRVGEFSVHRGLFSRFGNYWRFLAAARRCVAAHANAGDVVVPMTDPPMLGAGISLAARRAGAATVHWIQDIYPEIVMAHAGPWIAAPLIPLRAMRDRAWRLSAACVCVGRGISGRVERSGVPSSRIANIPNWAPADLDSPPKEADIRDRRTAWKIDDKFVVAYSGNLGRVHDFTAILGAAAELKDDSSIRFLILGDGPKLESVRAVADSKRFANVTFLPAQPRAELAVSLAAADAHLVSLAPEFTDLVYPSKLAGIMAAGRPALFVGKTESEIAEFLSREDCGFSFSTSHGRELARVVRDLQADAARRNALGRNARSTYERHFTLRTAATRWEELLSTIPAVR